LNEFQIEIEEGFFGQNFGPNFNILTGGGTGLSPGLLLWLLGRKSKKKRKPSLAYLVRLLRTIDIIRLLDDGQASN